MNNQDINFNMFMNMMMQMEKHMDKSNSFKVDKNDPSWRLIDATNKIMTRCIPGSIYKVDKNAYNPFLYTTENLEYISGTKCSNAFTILGAGDPVFELLANDVKDITACEINELQILVYKLRVAAIKTFNKNGFIRFMIDFNHSNFFNVSEFNRVRKNFIDDKELYNYWSYFCNNYSKELINVLYYRTYRDSNHMLKKEIVNNLVNGLSWLDNYDKVKSNLDNANINVVLGDAVTTLENNDKTYDYIDLTNILLFAYQSICNSNVDSFKEYMNRIVNIYNNKLNSNGLMAVDYMFNSNIDKIINGNNFDNIGYDLYNEVYTYLKDHLPIILKELGSINTTPEGKQTDTVILVKK